MRAAIGTLQLSFNLSLYKMDNAAYQPPGGRDEVVAIVRALNAYGEHFEHPGWKSFE